MDSSFRWNDGVSYIAAPRRDQVHYPPPMVAAPERNVRIAVYAALAGLIAAAYWQTPFHDFVDYDDTLYVTAEPMAQRGITLEGIRWAFTDTSSGNWHPLTRLAHMLDCELFGLNPAGHHVMSVLGHIAATLLLLGVLHGMTSAFWPSAFAAALFGLHPLHVESVAWISERKDVMSAICWFAAMGLYTRYVRNPSVVRYVAVAMALAIGLMFKAMLVTLPFVLLLLDFWPLCRWDALDKTAVKRTAWLVLEKVPLFLIVIAHAFITYQSQSLARSTMDAIPLKQRTLNAIISYDEYRRDTLFPMGLAAFYPFPFGDDLAGRALASGGLLVVITVFIVWFWRHVPYLLVGWFWFLGTLVPVIGLVQVGLQARADRYMYIPSVGLFIAIAFAFAHVGVRPQWRKPAAGLVAGIVVACAIASAVQSRYWSDTLTLFERALAVTDDNLIAHTNVASEYAERGDTEKAREHFGAAIAIDERQPWGAVAANAYFGLAQLDEQAGDFVAAEKNYLAARNRKPEWSEANNNLAGVYMAMGDRAARDGDVESRAKLFRTAMALAEEALKQDPNNHAAMLNLAYLCQHFGEQTGENRWFVDAASFYERALPHTAPSAPIHYNFSLVLHRLGRTDEAIGEAERAVALDPKYTEAESFLERLREHTAPRPE
jgi:protein O-mannosyl-transferase